MYIPILEAHALNTGTNTNIDHARLDGIGNISNGLETAGALSVETLDSGGLRETSDKSGGTEFGGTATRREDGTNGDILNEIGVNLALLNDSLKDTGQHVGGGSVLEATLSALGERRTQSAGYDDIVGVLFGKGSGTLLATEVGGNLVKTLLGWSIISQHVVHNAEEITYQKT